MTEPKSRPGPPPRPMQRGEERREHPRKEAGCRVLVLSPQKAEASLADISRSGLRLAFERANRFQKGAELNVSFTLPGSDLKITSRLEVVRRQGAHELGLRFLRVSPEILAAIDAYVAQR